MSKELEALERGILEFEKELKDDCNNEWLKRVVAGMKKCYQRLEKIDNSSPSEALSYIDAFIEGNNNDIKNQNITGFDIDTQAKWVKYLEHKSFMLSTIKQALLKEQEQEKLIIELCEYCGMDNLYPYDNLNEIEIAFKDTFDNYQRQRIESLGRLNKQQKVLKIIKEKGIDIGWLKQCNIIEEYNYHCEAKQLTQEEYDAVKRYFK